MTDDQQNPADHPPKPIKIRALATSKDVRRANLKIINAVLAGTIEPAIANSALYGLNNLQRSIDSELIEARLAELEERAVGRLSNPSRASRHARH